MWFQVIILNNNNNDNNNNNNLLGQLYGFKHSYPKLKILKQIYLTNR